MKRVTASEARRNWFRLLDEVAAGAVVVIERAGRRVLLQLDPADAASPEVPDYTDLIRAPDAEHADGWGWTWEPDAPLLTPHDLGEEDREA